MKRAIVTGANGFIGCALVRELVRQGVRVTALDREGANGNLPESELVTFYPMELEAVMGLEQTVKERGFDVFYHLAWAGSAGEARADIWLQLKNAGWTADCLKLAKKLGCARFVCAGSIMEHETIAAAYTQGNKPGPGYIYGSGKVASHTMCMPAAAQLGIDLVWAEITNAYGPGERSPRLVNTTIRRILKGEPVSFTAGTQNYDFVYISDVARAFYCIGEKGKPFHEYLIGSGNARPLKEFLLEMQKAVAPDTEFRFGDIPFTGVTLPASAFDTSATRKDTGFEAVVSFGEGTKYTMEWLKGEQE